MAHRNLSQFSRILQRWIGKDNRKQSNRNVSRARRSLRVEPLEARRVFAGLLFDSVQVLGSETASAFGTAQAIDLAGNTYMGGHFTGTLDFDRTATPPGGTDVLTSVGSTDAFVAKYAPNNQLLWVRRMGGISSDYLDDLKVDGAGNIYVGGRFSNSADFGSTILSSVSSTDSFVAKLDANGNSLWAKGSGGTLSSSIGEVAIDQAGNLTTIGYIGIGITTQFSIRNYDTHGNSLWEASFPTYSAESRVSIRNVVTDQAGNLYFSGGFAGTVDLDPGLGEFWVTGSTPTTGLSTSKNSYLMKLSRDGEMEWVVPQIAADAEKIYISELIIGEDGNLVFLGSATGPVDIDSSSIEQLLPSGDNSFFAKMNPTGELLSSSTHPGTSPVDNLVSFQGRFYGTGNLIQEGIFNPSPEILVTGYGKKVDNNNAQSTGLIVEYDQAGTVLSAGRIGGTGAINGVAAVYMMGVSVDSAGGIYVTGWSGSNHTDYDPSPVRENIVLNPSTADAFRLKLKIPAPTKFFVVDDAWTDKTYEYTSGGSAIENYSLGFGNAAPRGAASRVAGDKVWVVDANRKVYSYNDSGTLLGSWTAGTLANNAIVEGIATNGTDVWIVDAKSDRVYRYNNAAGLITGSPNAVSSFALNGSNTNPKDIVTDGIHLWVVNDSTKDKVFKYTMTGSLVGSWTIDSANKSPTGITLDPSGISQSLWIVDNGTDRVYEYVNARGKSSGSQAAIATFALAAGNTNPQGIADPPPSGNPANSSRRPAAPNDTLVTPPFVVGLASNNDRLTTNEVTRKLPSGFETTRPFYSHPIASHRDDQHSLPQSYAIAERSNANEADESEDAFLFNDSYDRIDDALLSLLAKEQMV